MFYRIKQFYLALTAQVSLKEKEFVNSYLNIKEQELFEKLRVSEQKHCINVAYDISNHIMDKERTYLIRLGLLHDIGKIKVKLTPVDKGVIVILDKLTKGKLKRYTHYKKINSYYNHGAIGSEILGQIGDYDQRFLEMIRTHHCKKIKDDDLLKILQRWDDRN